MKFSIYNFQFSRKSFTLVEVLVVAFLILIIFLGLFAAYQLGFKVIGLNERKVAALQIAQGEMEKIRNLPYLSVGITNATLPKAKGILESSTTTYLNGVSYNIERNIEFVSDSTDDPESGSPPCLWDYKKVEIKVSWSGRTPGQVKLTSTFSPKDKVEEYQACSEQPGGILSVQVFDAFGNLISSPQIEVFNASGTLVATASPSDGRYDFPLATSTYKVKVSKSGYSSEETFGSGDNYQGNIIATPEKPHPLVLVSQITNISFSIDKVSSFSISTLSPWSEDYFSDSFLDESKISEKANTVIFSGQASLATTTEGGYYLSGFLTSIAISPATLLRWNEFSFNDEKPTNTDLRYQFYYASGTNWYLIPDADLPGNSTGFDSSPINLSSLSTTTYSQLKIKANFSTNNTSTTPLLKEWQLSWIMTEGTPIINAQFNLRGSKVVGKDSSENPIYKYSITTTTDANGNKNLNNLEWDNYTFSINPGTGLDLIAIDPSPQPISLLPDTTQSVKLYLDSQNSLLITVQDLITLSPVFSATVRLFKSDYDKSQYTNEKGQTLFIPLDVDNYNIEVSAEGYNSTSSTILVSGDETRIIKIQLIE